MNNDAPVAAGIDVAKATLSVCIRNPDGSERALTLRNIEADIKEKILPLLAGCSGKCSGFHGTDVTQQYTPIVSGVTLNWSP